MARDAIRTSHQARILVLGVILCQVLLSAVIILDLHLTVMLSVFTDVIMRDVVQLAVRTLVAVKRMVCKSALIEVAAVIRHLPVDGRVFGLWCGP